VTFRSVQLWTTVVVVVFAPLFFGSVDLFWVVVWTIILSVGVLCSVAVPLEPRQSRIAYCFLALCGVYALVAIVQVIPNAIPRWNDPIWRQTDELLGAGALARISSRAEIPPLAVGHFLLFFTSFISGFTIGTSQRNSHKLLLFAQYSILAYALYGFAALILTPNMVLWAPKAYRGSLTATFINRNTAATFIGAGTILWFCSAIAQLQEVRFSSMRLLLLTRSNEDLTFRIIVRSGATLVCFFGLLLTGSRGGLICTCFGLLVSVTLMLVSKQQPKFWRVLVSAGVTILVTIGWLSGMGRIGSQGVFDEGRWSVYQICVEAIRQRPFLGSGVGTFAEIFPSLRGASFPSWGVWDYAHSTILEIAMEMGIPVAALVVIAALASLFLVGRAAITSSKGSQRRPLAAIAGIMVLSYLHSTIDFSLQIPGYFILFGVLLGCGLAKSSKIDLAARAPSSFVSIAKA
jgi:hypothetical protein